MGNIKALAVTLLMSIPASALAVPVLVGDADSVDGILGLEIDGALYDVTFSQGGTSYEQFFGTDTPTFLGDASDLSAPTAAAAAIEAFLTANSVTGITNLVPGDPANPLFVLFIPAFIDEFPGPDLVSAVNLVFNSGTWTSGGQGRTGSQVTTQTNLAWVRFDAITVPEPGTLAIFVTGLAALGLWRPRRRNRGAT